MPIIEFILRYQSENNTCHLKVTDYSNINSKGMAKSSHHYIESYTVQGDDRSCDVQLGAEFSSCHSNQVLSSNGYASVRLKPVWNEEIHKHLFSWTISLYRQKKYHEGMIRVMCNK